MLTRTDPVLTVHIGRSCCFPVNKVNVSSLQALRSSMVGTTDRGKEQREASRAAPQQGGGGGGPEQSQSSKNLLASLATDRPRGKFHRHNYVTSNQ